MRDEKALHFLRSLPNSDGCNRCAPANRQCEVAGSQAASTVNAIIVRSSFTAFILAHSAVGLKALGKMVLGIGNEVGAVDAVI